MEVPGRPVNRYQASCKVGLVMCFDQMSSIYDCTKFNGAVYRKALTEVVFPFSRKRFPQEQVYLIQDNDPSHLGAATKTLMRNNNILFEDKYKFPANSGDLNPVENVWGCILDQLDLKEYDNKEMILEGVRKAARKVNKTHLKHMVDSMPHRMELVIANEGGRCGY